MSQEVIEEREVGTEEASAPVRRTSARRRAGAVLIVLLLVGLVAGGLVWRAHRLPGDAAMRVDGTVVTRSALREDVATLRAMYGVEPPQSKTKLAAFWRDAAKASAVSRILDAAARRQHVVIPGRKVDEALAAYVAALYQGSTDAHQQFVAALANAGTSEPAVKVEIRRRLTVDALSEKVVSGVKEPTVEEVAAAFEKRRCSLAVPETRRLRNIVVATEGEARSVLSELRGGAAFAEVARTRSADASTRDQGGDLGTVSESQLDAGYARAAFGAKEKALFGPVRTTSGWNVGQVVAIVPGRTASLAEVATALREQLLLEKQSRVWQSWLGKQIADAHVQYAAAYRPAHPDAVPEGIGAWAKTQEGLCSPGTVGP